MASAKPRWRPLRWPVGAVRRRWSPLVPRGTKRGLKPVQGPELRYTLAAGYRYTKAPRNTVQPAQLRLEARCLLHGAKRSKMQPIRCLSASV